MGRINNMGRIIEMDADQAARRINIVLELVQPLDSSVQKVFDELGISDDTLDLMETIRGILSGATRTDEIKSILKAFYQKRDDLSRRAEDLL